MQNNFKFQQFINSLENKSVTFLGLGVSHIETIKMLAKKKIKISVRDKKNIEQISKKNNNTIDELKALNVKLILGENYLDNIESEEDVVFRTPGMNFNHPVFKILKNKTVITSEMEVFFEACPCKIIGVTGSDGKTTTSSLINEILKTAGFKVHLGGNIGKPLLPIVESIEPDDIAVVELSSFQLISMRKSPNISVITNISPNHLDVHSNMDEYIDAKKNIFLHQSSFDRVIFSCDDKICQSLLSGTTSLISLFGSQENISQINSSTNFKNSVVVDKNNDIYLLDGPNDTSPTFLFNSKEIKLPGEHNTANFLAAIAATQDIVDNSVYKQVANNFQGVEHRIEFVRELNHVKWFNDSIATSPSRTIAGLRAFEKKVILIAGGYDKKISYQPLVPYILDKVSYLILTGDTSDIIYRSVTSHCDYKKSNLKIKRVENLSAAVAFASSIALCGDTVFFSPASASFDSYENFEERGKHFKKLVLAL